MLDQLNAMFQGRRVRITHTSERLQPIECVCKVIHQVPGSTREFNLETQDGGRIGFVPEIVTATSTDGPLLAFAGGRRKIEVLPLTTAEKEQMFRIRDRVVWNSELNAGSMIARYGPGPFEVVGLYLHHPDIIAKGHFPVGVTIELGPERRQDFDGAWFKKVN
jgi:hypothetical protein